MIMATAITKDRNGKIKTKDMVIYRNLLFAARDNRLRNNRDAIY